MTNIEQATDRFTGLVEPITIQRITDQGRCTIQDIALREEPCTLYVNSKETFRFFCMPQHQDALAVGYCISTGLLRARDALTDVCVSQNGSRVDISLIPNLPAEPSSSALTQFTPEEIHHFQDLFNQQCVLFRKTGAAHSVALADRSGLLIFIEDVARHNALDKVIGRMFLSGIPADNKLFLFSGRVAEDMVIKVVASGVKMIVAPGAPTLSAIRIAKANNITMMGFVRHDNINIYAAAERII